MSKILNILQALWNATNPHAKNEFVTKSVCDQVDAKVTAAQTAADQLAARIDGMYPVGCIWITLGSTDPNTILPGTWAKTAEGRMIIGTGTLGGDTYAASDLGGTARHALTGAELPSHTHENLAWATQAPEAHQHGGFDGVAAAPANKWQESIHDKHTKATGGGQAHENRPPYQAANIWQRTA